MRKKQQNVIFRLLLHLKGWDTHKSTDLETPHLSNNGNSFYTVGFDLLIEKDRAKKEL